MTAAIAIRPLPLDEAVARWAGISPILKRATDRTEGRYEPMDLLRSAMMGRVGIWLIEDGDQLLGVAVVEMRLHPEIQPRVKDLEISFIAGDRLNEWCGQFDAAMAELGRVHGCKSVRTTVGRPGWARFWRAHGVMVKVAGAAIVRDL